MKKFKLEELTWDSQFFGYQVARITVPSSEVNVQLSEVREQIYDFKLCYVFTDQRLINDINAFDDERVVFEYRIKKGNKMQNPLIKSVDSSFFNKLLELAYASGVYSRFKLDPKFKVGEFEILYKEWLKGSLNGTMADEVLVYQEDGNCAGFITLVKKLDVVEIGLIAIAAEYRGRGIGTALIRSAFFCTEIYGRNLIRVATQRRNHSAISFYLRNGFSETEHTFIYHVWK